MSELQYFTLATVAAILFTTLFCSRRIARKKRVSVGTLLMGAFCAATLATVCLPVSDAGIAAFTYEYWSHLRFESGMPIPFIFTIWAFGFFLCVLPALVVVLYYQRRSKRDAKPVV